MSGRPGTEQRKKWCIPQKLEVKEFPCETKVLADEVRGRSGRGDKQANPRVPIGDPYIPINVEWSGIFPFAGGHISKAGYEG